MRRRHVAVTSEVSVEKGADHFRRGLQQLRRDSLALGASAAKRLEQARQRAAAHFDRYRRAPIHDGRGRAKYPSEQPRSPLHEWLFVMTAGEYERVGIRPVPVLTDGTLG